MKKSDESNRVVMTPVFRRKIAEYLAAHLEAHLPPGHPAKISLHDAPVSSTRLAAGKFVVTSVLPVYVAQLNQLARACVADLAPSGFILLVTTPSRQKLLVEADDRSHAPSLIRVFSGETVKMLERALTSVAAPPNKGQTSLRILRSASLHLYAIWRHSAAPDQTSYCVPFTANFAGVKVGRRYTIRRFQQLLQSAALQCILRWYERTTNREVENERATADDHSGAHAEVKVKVRRSKGNQSPTQSSRR